MSSRLPAAYPDTGPPQRDQGGNSGDYGQAYEDHFEHDGQDMTRCAGGALGRLSYRTDDYEGDDDGQDDADSATIAGSAAAATVDSAAWHHTPTSGEETRGSRRR
jgi:hypothetical protein